MRVHDSTHREDLELARAALGGDTTAQRSLDALIRAEAKRATVELRQPAWIADEIHQELAQKLLVGPEPKLAQYAGQSALGRWLGVAATRTGLNLLRKKNPERAFADHDADAIASALASPGGARGIPTGNAVIAPELALLRERYRAEVEHAIRAAFESLDAARDRNLLRLYYLERVGLDRLGRMYSVHASTVSRWLATLRETIVADVNHRLGEALGMIGKYADVESLIRAVRSDLDITLSRLLQ